MASGPKIIPKQIAQLHESMTMGRIPIIVMGSGMSAGVGAPTMSAIHTYLLEELRKGDQNSAVKVVQELLQILEKEEVESPRSVQVRLYHLLQKSQDTRIRTVWAKFGADLMSGLVATKDPSRKTKVATPLWKLTPSLAHEWAARLAVQGRAVVVSLNYDGLTRKAMESIATEIMQPPPENRRSARILSSADEIRSFFTGIESDISAVMANNSVASAKQTWRPVPIIKFRGDVFHAMCENGRCSACSKPAPLYDLLDLKDEAGEPSETAIPLALSLGATDVRPADLGFDGHVIQEGTRILVEYDSSIASRQRRRFTIAHEVGHLILWNASGGIKKIAARRSTEKSEVEELCNKLAAEILAPQAEVLSLWKASAARMRTALKSDFIVELAQRFDISVNFAAIRFKELCSSRGGVGLINNADRRFEWAHRVRGKDWLLTALLRVLPTRAESGTDSYSVDVAGGIETIPFEWKNISNTRCLIVTSA